MDNVWPVFIFLAFFAFVVLVLILDTPRGRACVRFAIKHWRTLFGLMWIGGLLFWYWPEASQERLRNFSTFPDVAAYEYLADRNYDGYKSIANAIVVAAAMIAIGRLMRPTPRSADDAASRTIVTAPPAPPAPPPPTSVDVG